MSCEGNKNNSASVGPASQPHRRRVTISLYREERHIHRVLGDGEKRLWHTPTRSLRQCPSTSSQSCADDEVRRTLMCWPLDKGRSVDLNRSQEHIVPRNTMSDDRCGTNSVGSSENQLILHTICCTKRSRLRDGDQHARGGCQQRQLPRPPHGRVGG